MTKKRARSALSKKKSLTDFAIESAGPCDPEIFLFLTGVYGAAAHLSMPVPNPESEVTLEHEGKGYVLSDLPVNRGMVACVKEMRSMGVEHRERYLCRLMHVGEVLRDRVKFAAFIKDGNAPGEMQVEESLLKAMATAEIVIADDQMHFDLEDVFRVAQKLQSVESK